MRWKTRNLDNRMKLSSKFLSNKLLSLPVNNYFVTTAFFILERAYKNLKENVANFQFFYKYNIFHITARYSWKIQSVGDKICCDATRLTLKFLANPVSLVEVLRNNILGFIEECRVGIRAYHCRSCGFTYRRFPFLVRVWRLTV